MEKSGILIAGIYLAVMAVIDRRQKKIPIAPGVVCIVFIVLAQIVAENRVGGWLPGIWIGVFLLIVSKLSRGGIGEGDAMVYFVTGLALGFFRNLELLMLSLIFAAMTGLVMLVVKKVGRKYTLPFVPFTAVAYGMVLLL